MKLRTVHVIGLLAILSTLSACGSKQVFDPAAGAPPPAKIDEVPDVNVIQVSYPDRFPLTAAIAYHERPSLDVTGVVSADVSRTIPVVSLVSGRVTGLYAHLGDDVKKGQLLIRIQSSDLASGFSDYSKAKADEQLARAQQERAQLLYGRGAIDINLRDGASQIYRENNSRYVAIKYSVRGRDLGSTVEEAIRQVNERVKLPPGYSLEWAGEYASAKEANARLAVFVPVTVAVIFFLLYSMFGSFKWAGLAMASVALSPIGACSLSISRERTNVRDAAVEGAVLRLRPIMMTMLVATLGLLPAAISTGIGSDSQKPFAIVIVGGLRATLLLSVYVLPTVYTWIASPRDRLPPAEPDLVEPR